MAEEVKKEAEAVEERSAVKEFLDAIPKEGESPIKGTEDETSPEPSAEKKDEKETPLATEDKKEGEENIPFHKHPRFKQLVSERKELREKVENYETRLAQLESKAIPDQKTTEIPAWFSHLYGENAEAWRLYQGYNQTERENIKQEIIRDSQKAQTQEAERRKAMDQWVSTNLQELRDEGIKFDENKLLKVLVDYSPTDNQGNIDFRKGLDILEKIERLENSEVGKKIQAKKEIASSTTTKLSGDPKGKPTLTAKQLRKMSWQELVE